MDLPTEHLLIIRQINVVPPLMLDSDRTTPAEVPRRLSAAVGTVL